MRSPVISSLKFAKRKPDETADIALVNRISGRNFTPEQVYCFSVILKDNKVISDDKLKKHEQAFVGVKFLVDIRWNAETQMAQVYRTEAEVTGIKITSKRYLTLLRGDAFIPNIPANKPLLAAIEARRKDA
jgi:hypothetical protein